MPVLSGPFKVNLTSQHIQICIGVDAHFDVLPSFFRKELRRLGPKKFLSRWSGIICDAAEPNKNYVKLQSAFFERLGHDGLIVQAKLCDTLKRRHVPTILDAKRCDISSTMTAYLDSAFTLHGARVLTVVPYMGLGFLPQLIKYKPAGKGLFIVWRSSNVDAKWLQDEVALTLLQKLTAACRELELQDHIGLVVGADQIDLMPDDEWHLAKEFALLIPGFGAQGGRYTHAIERKLEQGSRLRLINHSRALSGIGDLSKEAHLKQIKSWPDYEGFVAEQFKTLADATGRPVIPVS